MHFSEAEVEAIREIVDRYQYPSDKQRNLRRRIELPSEEALDTVHLDKEGRLANKVLNVSAPSH